MKFVVCYARCTTQPAYPNKSTPVFDKTDSLRYNSINENSAGFAGLVQTGE